MKLFKILSFFILLGFATACSTTESAQSSQAEQNSQVQSEDDSKNISDQNDYFRTLADFLQRVPGVNVSGTQNNKVVTIRGINSFNAGIEPLFVIDGQVAGTTYAQVHNMINVREIDYVRVLKGSEAAGYGVRGGNGVILIVTKR
ncbi:MAG TPA: TonB-dependent receptor plug domain-containing protein [Balneolaceae bacterium]|jgi:TonB-dependent SusC/RagA subfamily outer membrane receptor|nr:TonB-dependent receptor plug domain-containing protein [Balneolaceae bacterium]